MPPLSDPQASHTSATLPSENENAQKNDALRSVVEEALTNFVTDTMYDKPDNLLLYMAEWARRQQRDASGTQRAKLSPTPPPRDGAAPRHAPRGAAAEAKRLSPADASLDADGVDNVAAQLMSLAQHRHRHLRDKAEGCRDHYLMSLEDSDGDIFHVDSLQKKMTVSRAEAANAKADTDTVAAQIKEIDDGDDTAAVKRQKKAELLSAYEQQWANDLPQRHR